MAITAADVPMPRGLLIAVEGGDRCGKTTQCRLLMDWLRGVGRQAVYQKFPDRTTQIGAIIHEYLSNKVDSNDHSIHLLFSANRWELQGRVRQLLSQGAVVLCDRYVPSGIAYSAAKGLDLKWCAVPDDRLPKPDLVIFLDSPAETAAQREDYGSERYERVDLQTKVRSIFLTSLKDDTWRIVDASRSVEQVFADIRAVVEAALERQLGAVEEYNFKW